MPDKKIRVIVYVEGGVVQEITADDPTALEVLLVDHDDDYSDDPDTLEYLETHPDDRCLTLVTFPDGDKAAVSMGSFPCDKWTDTAEAFWKAR